MIDPFMEAVARRRKERKKMFSEMKGTCMHVFHKPQQIKRPSELHSLNRKMKKPNIRIGIKPMRDERGTMCKEALNKIHGLKLGRL